MAVPAIRVQNLSKSYRLGLTHGGSVREMVNGAAARLFGRKRQSAPNRPPGRSDRTDADGLFWALRDISFSIGPGEVVGVIGKNGAGKSTLLKVLSHITLPDAGRIEIRGRVASLLEVGTGFHPELTGRENVFLNGAILGMTKAEIRRQFDEIVGFAEIGEFIDTPVKRYSSGMYVRLAFAVAAHLDPEILIVDEVLAVGDASFQKKCLGKMSEVSSAGRTVLFVSHNMIAVQKLCQRAFWLAGGELAMSGPTAKICQSYLGTERPVVLDRVWADAESAPGNEHFRLHRIAICTDDRNLATQVTTAEPVRIEIDFTHSIANKDLALTLHAYTADGVIAFGTSTAECATLVGQIRPGSSRCSCEIPANLLNSGELRLTLLVVYDDTHLLLRLDDVVSFTVIDSVASRAAWYGKKVGVVRPLLPWTITPLTRT